MNPNSKGWGFIMPIPRKVKARGSGSMMPIGLHSSGGG